MPIRAHALFLYNRGGIIAHYAREILAAEKNISLPEVAGEKALL